MAKQQAKASWRGQQNLAGWGKIVVDDRGDAAYVPRP